MKLEIEFAASTRTADCQSAVSPTGSRRARVPQVANLRSSTLTVCATLAAFAPAKVFACAACYGANIDDRMADGMNWAILTLGVIIATVLGAFLAFLIRVIRRSEALETAAQSKSPKPSKI